MDKESDKYKILTIKEYSPGVVGTFTIDDIVYNLRYNDMLQLINNFVDWKFKAYTLSDATIYERFERMQPLVDYITNKFKSLKGMDNPVAEYSADMKLLMQYLGVQDAAWRGALREDLCTYTKVCAAIGILNNVGITEGEHYAKLQQMATDLKDRLVPQMQQSEVKHYLLSATMLSDFMLRDIMIYEKKRYSAKATAVGFKENSNEKSN